MKDPEVIKELSLAEGLVRDDDGTFSNDNPRFDFNLFRCYWCLAPYSTWEQSRACNCDKSGTPEQMIR